MLRSRVSANTRTSSTKTHKYNRGLELAELNIYKKLGFVSQSMLQIISSRCRIKTFLNELKAWKTAAFSAEDHSDLRIFVLLLFGFKQVSRSHWALLEKQC